MKGLRFLFLFAIVVVMLSSCTETPTPKLVFKFTFDSTQTRLDNLGNPAVMPANHRGQHPTFNQMSAHYIELAPGMFTALGTGAVIYLAPSSTAGGG